MKNQYDVRERFAQQETAFEPELYQQLVQAFKKGQQDGAWFDYDPFSYTQAQIVKPVVRSVKRPQNRAAEVDIDVYVGPGSTVPDVGNYLYRRKWHQLS